MKIKRQSAVFRSVDITFETKVEYEDFKALLRFAKANCIPDTPVEIIVNTLMSMVKVIENEQ